MAGSQLAHAEVRTLGLHAMIVQDLLDSFRVRERRELWPKPIGEHSSSLVTPISATILANAGKSLSIERNGQTWHPIGKPSGRAVLLVSSAFLDSEAPVVI